MNDALGVVAKQPERPFGRVAVGVETTGPEREWLDTVLDILSREPPFGELPQMFVRMVQATPEQPLGVLHSLGAGEDRPQISFSPHRSGEGWIVDVVSLGVDVGALAALLAVVAPSRLASSFGFPYTPVHDRSAPVDPRDLAGEPTGGFVRITHAKIEVTDATLPPTVGLRQWTYPTPT